MPRQIAEIEAEKAALEERLEAVELERAEAVGAELLKGVPIDTPQTLFALLRQAAVAEPSNGYGMYRGSQTSDWLELSPGLQVMVVVNVFDPDADEDRDGDESDEEDEADEQDEAA